MEKYGKDRHGTQDTIIRLMRFAWWLDRLETHTQNMNNLLLLHFNNSYTTVPQYYSYKYIVYLFFFVEFVLAYCSVDQL